SMTRNLFTNSFTNLESTDLKFVLEIFIKLFDDLARFTVHNKQHATNKFSKLTISLHLPDSNLSLYIIHRHHDGFQFERLIDLSTCLARLGCFHYPAIGSLLLGTNYIVADDDRRKSALALTVNVTCPCCYHIPFSPENSIFFCQKTRFFRQAKTCKRLHV
ncbi:hypothetical protein ALC53_13593, partial [Atta colombica]